MLFGLVPEANIIKNRVNIHWSLRFTKLWMAVQKLHSHIYFGLAQWSLSFSRRSTAISFLVLPFIPAEVSYDQALWSWTKFLLQLLYFSMSYGLKIWAINLLDWSLGLFLRIWEYNSRNPLFLPPFSCKYRCILCVKEMWLLGIYEGFKGIMTKELLCCSKPKAHRFPFSYWYPSSANMHNHFFDASHVWRGE